MKNETGGMLTERCRVYKHLDLITTQFRKSQFQSQPWYPVRIGKQRQELQLLLTWMEDGLFYSVIEVLTMLKTPFQVAYRY